MSGSKRVVVRTDQPLPPLSWRDEVREVPHIWPQLAPVWLAATGDAVHGWTPWHTLAERGRGEWALLPGFVLAEPEPAGTDLGSWHLPESAFPLLVLGSPLGRCSDVAYSFWTPKLYESMVHAVVTDAAAAGVRGVLAPWIPDRQGSDALAHAMADNGAHTVPGGRLTRATPPDLPPIVPVDADVTTFDASTVGEVLPQVCELIAARTATAGPEAVGTLLSRLAEAGADLCGAITVHNGTPAAVGVAVRKAHDLFVPFVAATDRDERDVCLRAILDDQLGRTDSRALRSIELGSSIDDSAVLPNARPRELTTALLVLDASARPQAYADLDESAEPTPAAT